MWDFSSTLMTFDNAGYLFDGTTPFVPPSPTLPSGTVSLYGNRVTLPAKKIGETVIVPFDFISKLAMGETISGAVTTATVYTGVDSNPGAIIDGTATINGTVVNQLVTGGVLGTIYSLLVAATTSLGQTLELSGYLAIVPNLP